MKELEKFLAKSNTKGVIMGARATITMIPQSKTIEDKENCPSIYVHWHGAMVENFLDQAKEVMGDKLGDDDYTFARLVQSYGNEIDCFADTRRMEINLLVSVPLADIFSGDDYGDYFVDNNLDIIEHTKGDWQK